MWYFLSFLVFWIFLDLFTKNLAKEFLQKKIEIINNFLYLEYTQNTGIAFSIALEGIFLKIITIILIIALFYYFFKYEFPKKNNLLNISFWLILAWAIGNWYERIFNSYVIDFIWVKYFSVFNLADSFITIWAIIFLIITFFNTKQEKKW